MKDTAAHTRKKNIRFLPNIIMVDFSVSKKNNA